MRKNSLFKGIKLLLLFAVLILIGFQNVFAAIFDEDVRDAFHNYAKTMSVKRTPLLFTSGKKVHNCIGYLKEKKTFFY